MGRADYYKDGSNNVICDSCGRKFKAGSLARQWDGIWACRQCFDYRQPQDFVRGVEDDTKPVLSRPEAPDTFTQGAQDLPVPSEQIPEGTFNQE